MRAIIRTKDAIETARSLIGTPYNELDCINLIKAVIRRAPGGVKSYQTAGTATLWASGNLAAGNKYRDLTERRETITGAQAGMLAFKGKPLGFGGQPQHIGLVTDVGTVIHSSSVYGKVVETPLTTKEGWTLTATHRYIAVNSELNQGVDEPVQNADETQTPTTINGGGRVLYAAEVTTENGGLNMRSGPGKEYPRIAVLPRGTEVDVLVESDGWAFVMDDGISGYVSAEYLTRKEAEASEEPESEWGTWHVSIPCFSREQAEALALLIPGAVIMMQGGND